MLTIERLTEALGAEVKGVNLAEPPDGETFDQLLSAFHRYQVLLFRRQTLTPEQHIAFSRRFGPLEEHVQKQYLLPGYPEILVLSNELKPDGTRVSIADGGSGWHSDLSYMKKPSLGSVLYALEVPEQGGETEWANMHLVYEGLSEQLKKRLEGLKAIHQFDQRFNPRLPPPDLRYRDEHSEEVRALTPDVIHPVVRTHPVTGRKALFVSLRFTIGIADLDPAESDALLDELLADHLQSQFCYRHKWHKGDVLMWDNRCTNHRAVGGVVQLPQIRRLHRTTIAGDEPF